MKKLLTLSTVLMAALLVSVASAKETGTTRYEVELMAAPYRDAKLVTQLSGNTRVDILERRGAWIRVSADTHNGWVRMHQVRLGEGPEKKSGSGLTALWSVGQTGRSGTEGIVATTGIRGMSAEELKKASPDPAGVRRMDQFRANPEAARGHAAAAGLKEKDVAFLPKPE
jgi:hypothetical protein